MAKNSSNTIQTLKIRKIIVIISKIIALISTKLIVLFTAKLFTTPIRHKIPLRELSMDQNTIQKIIKIPAINKEVVVYKYGTSEKRVLLVHGWSGRGTQLFKIADELLKQGYSTISFDAPAHGKSPGNTTIMIDFITAILEIDKQFGPFDAAIGHSLGGMSVLNAIKKGLQVNHAVVIASGDIVADIIDDFIAKLELCPTIATLLSLYFEKKYNEKINDYSAFLAAKETNIPVLVIHDSNDLEVPVKAGINIYKHLKNGTLFLTEGLGHRKILGNQKVVANTVQFIQNI